MIQKFSNSKFYLICCYFMICLIFYRPKPPEEKEEETEVLDDESEINLDRIEEEMIAAYSDDSDEENIFRLDDLKSVKKEILSNELKSNVDEETWKQEVIFLKTFYQYHLFVCNIFRLREYCLY